jgi:hypothetical protein
LQIVYKLCDSLTHICMGGETLMRWREEKQAERLAGKITGAKELSGMALPASCDIE